MEPEGLERVAGAGGAAAPGPARGGAADVVADGVHDILRGVDPDAVPDRPGGAAVDLPVVVVEPVARGLPPAGRAAAHTPAVLKHGSLKSGSGCPDPRRPLREASGGGDAEDRIRGSDGGPSHPRAVESTSRSHELNRTDCNRLRFLITLGLGLARDTSR